MQKFTQAVKGIGYGSFNLNSLQNFRTLLKFTLMEVWDQLLLFMQLLM